MILDEIHAYKIREVETAKEAIPLTVLKEKATEAPQPRGFAAALLAARNKGPALIAEVKRASPSAGLIRVDFDHVTIAQTYESAGASAISVLTDEKFFQGSLTFLRDIRANAGLPLLRKEFIIDEYQVYEARAAGADAILLITHLLEQPKLGQLIELAQTLDMAALVEVHTASELARALEADAHIVGINNRDLHTFRVDLQTTFELRQTIPADKIVVSESGIKTREDVERLAAAEVHAMLIGETLMRSVDIAAKIRELCG